MCEYYVAQSPTTDPGEYADFLADMPSDLADIAEVTQGLIYHYTAGRYFYGWVPPAARLPEINTRTLHDILATVLAKDDRPLTAARAYSDRLLGCCRDFSLLACAILRYQGRAARLRYGFASYFSPGYWGDHVLVETWTGERWQRFDPQLAGLRDWGYDLLDVPEAAFVTGGCAWQMCRQEGADPERFGLGPDEKDVRGWWFIRQRLQLDVAALNKIELLCWDGIEGLHEDQAADQAILDEMATLSRNPNSNELRARCTTADRWQLPSSVNCFNPIIGPAFAVAVA
jgi:hypothetical protein